MTQTTCDNQLNFKLQSNIMRPMRNILYIGCWDEWKKQILDDLDKNPMTFAELAGKYGFTEGPASEHKPYHALLEIVSKMQTGTTHTPPLIKTASLESKYGFALYRGDQERMLVQSGILSEEEPVNLRLAASEEGLIETLHTMSFLRRERQR